MAKYAFATIDSSISGNDKTAFSNAVSENGAGNLYYTSGDSNMLLTTTIASLVKTAIFKISSNLAVSKFDIPSGYMGNVWIRVQDTGESNTVFAFRSQKRVTDTVYGITTRSAYVGGTLLIGNYMFYGDPLRVYLDNGVTEITNSGIFSTADYEHNTIEELYDSVIEAGFTPIPVSGDITYRLTNCTAPGAPASANYGEIVNVPIILPAGYGVVNPSTDAYVTNNGVVIDSSYSNGVLTFTMPNQS